MGSERRGAIADLTTAVERDASYAEGWSNRANMRQRSGDLRGAVGDYRKALELLGSARTPPARVVVESLGGIGWAAAERGKIDEAEGFYKRALAVAEQKLDRDAPELAPVLDGYAAVLRQRGLEGEARALEERAARVRGDEEGA